MGDGVGGEEDKEGGRKGRKEPTGQASHGTLDFYLASSGSATRVLLSAKLIFHLVSFSNFKR